MVLFELLQLARVFLYYLRIEYLWHALIMPLTNRNGNVIAAWAIFTGVLELVMAVALRREIENEWLLGLGGLVSVLIGVLLVVLPAAGLLSLVWLIGLYALVFGVALIFLGLRVRGHRTSIRVS